MKLGDKTYINGLYCMVIGISLITKEIIYKTISGQKTVRVKYYRDLEE